MDGVFSALERRFKGNRQLIRWARRLVEGEQGDLKRAARPYVDVTITGVSHDFDTFTTDEAVYSLKFTVHTKDRQASRCRQIMQELRNTYKDCNLDAAEFNTCGFLLTGAEGPMLESESEGTFTGNVSFDLHASLKAQSPPARRT